MKFESIKVGEYEGVTITEVLYNGELVEAEYEILDDDSFLNYLHLGDGKIEITPSTTENGAFKAFNPTIKQLQVVHNHLLIKVLPTWSKYT